MNPTTSAMQTIRSARRGRHDIASTVLLPLRPYSAPKAPQKVGVPSAALVNMAKATTASAPMGMGEKVTIALVSLAAIGGGVWFFVLRKKRKNPRRRRRSKKR
jgi:hypothetical protein